MIEEDVYDIKTCTSEDYTVRIDIPQKLWNEWLNFNVKDNNQKKSFKKYF